MYRQSAVASAGSQNYLSIDFPHSLRSRMKCYSSLAILCLSLSIVSGTSFAGNVTDSDSGIQGPPYSKILSEMNRWQSEHADISTVEQYGKSVKGRPLKMLVVGKKRFSQFKNRPAIVMSGSTHGNEYLNIEDRIPEALLKSAGKAGSVKTYLDEGGMFVFIPILNPDGYESRSRENAHGVDLNRDWDVNAANFKGFREVETRSLASKLNELKSRLALRYQVTVDYHCCAGAILYPWSYTAEPISNEQLVKYKRLGKMADSHLDIEYGTTGDILGYYATGTTKDYYHESQGALSFTYEGRYNKEHKLFDKHLEWWHDIVDFVGQGELIKNFLLFSSTSIFN